MKNSLLLLISLLFTTNSTFASYDGGGYYEDEYDYYQVRETKTVCTYGSERKKIVHTEVLSLDTLERYNPEISIDGQPLETLDYKFDTHFFTDPITGQSRYAYSLKLKHASSDNASSLELIASSLDEHIYNPSVSYRLRGKLTINTIYNQSSYEANCTVESEEREPTEEEKDFLFKDLDYDY